MAAPTPVARPQFGRITLQRINQLIQKRDDRRAVAGAIAAADLGNVRVHFGDAGILVLTIDRAKALVKSAGQDIRAEVDTIEAELASLGYVEETEPAATNAAAPPEPAELFAGAAGAGGPLEPQP